MRQLSTAAVALILMTGAAAASPAANDNAATTPTMTKPTATAQPPATPTPAPAKPMASAADHKAMHHTAMMHQARRDMSGDRDTKALNLLEANGYAQIEQFRADGKLYQATVKDKGRDVQVTVDPDTGQIQHRA